MNNIFTFTISILLLCLILIACNFTDGETRNDREKPVVKTENRIDETKSKNKEKNVFYANLEKGNQHWKGYFYQASKYSGEIRNKGEVLDIKFVDINSFSGINDNSHSWKFYLEKITNSNLLMALVLSIEPESQYV